LLRFSGEEVGRLPIVAFVVFLEHATSCYGLLLLLLLFLSGWRWRV
jgi:hypothetical protein